ncbi:MAG: hypothetical protein ACLVEU_14895 [Bacteroides cellulosilyticus]
MFGENLGIILESFRRPRQLEQRGCSRTGNISDRVVHRCSSIIIDALLSGLTRTCRVHAVATRQRQRAPISQLRLL